MYHDSSRVVSAKYGFTDCKLISRTEALGASHNPHTPHIKVLQVKY